MEVTLSGDHCFPVMSSNDALASGASRLDHLSRLDIDQKCPHIRGTSIICTIGPASRDVPKLVEMLRAGMTIARMNFSHGTHEYHAETIANVREAVKVYQQEEKIDYHPIAIALDTKGPEIRTGLLESGISGEAFLVKGNEVRITTNDAYAEKCSSSIVWLDYKNIVNVVAIGFKIFIDDGLISLIVKSIGADELVCVVENDGKLGSKKGVNLPGANVDLPAVSEKDKSDIQFAIEQDLDMIFASFIRKRSDLQEIRALLGSRSKDMLIISKVENHEGVKKLDEIIEASDGVMVARGDLGIEIPTEKVFIAQKMMIAKCNAAGKPVICATHMLESMVDKPRPTRAETSDVANAIIDGADCVMLSGETAKGSFPVQAVATMAAISLEAEAALHTDSLFVEMSGRTLEPADATSVTALAAVNASLSSDAAAIVVITLSGKTAHMVSKYRPKCPVITVTNSKRVARQLHLWRGCYPLLYEGEFKLDEQWTKDVEDRISRAISFGKSKGCLNTGDNVVLITGWRPGSGASNTLSVVSVP